MNTNKHSLDDFGFRYFNYSELVHTNTGLRNIPSLAAVSNLTRLFDSLDEFRDYLGYPIIVNSAYRSPAVNKAVGGVSNSDHMLGFAADIVCPLKYKSFDLFVDLFRYFFDYKNSELHHPFTQCIVYRNRKFIHVSVNPKHRSSVTFKL